MSRRRRRVPATDCPHAGRVDRPGPDSELLPCCHDAHAGRRCARNSSRGSCGSAHVPWSRASGSLTSRDYPMYPWTIHGSDFRSGPGFYLDVLTAGPSIPGRADGACAVHREYRAPRSPHRCGGAGRGVQQQRPQQWGKSRWPVSGARRAGLGGGRSAGCSLPVAFVGRHGTGQTVSAGRIRLSVRVNDEP